MTVHDRAHAAETDESDRAPLCGANAYSVRGRCVDGVGMQLIRSLDHVRASSREIAGDFADCARWSAPFRLFASSM